VGPAGLDMARWFLLVERDPVVRAILASPLPVPGPIVRAAVAEVYKRIAFHRPGKVDGAVVRSFAGHVATKAVAARTLAAGRRLLPELRTPFRLEEISCPVLLVWGRHDLLVFQTGAERVLEAAPQGRLEVIEDCGHCPQIEAPDRLTELILEFAGQRARAA
jgi:pimeloyl-ACP methyl ester carboxylesterase